MKKNENFFSTTGEVSKYEFVTIRFWFFKIGIIKKSLPKWVSLYNSGMVSISTVLVYKFCTFANFE